MSTSEKWSSRLKGYKSSDNFRAAIELIITFVPLACLWVVLAKLVVHGTLLSTLAFFPVLILAAGLIIRLFIVQHDCGHGSFLSSKAANDYLGRFCGVFTYTPYEYWRLQHAGHHATSGDLDRRGIGDIDTLTIKEYSERSFLGRLQYRLYRHPIMMFIIGSFYMFLLRQRIPVGMMGKRNAWISCMGNNIAILAVSAAIISIVGLKTFLLVQIPLIVTGGSIGIWLFYVQHQFDETYWSRRPDWTAEKAAMEGSSFYDLPKPLMWMTGYIGIHHVHHLSSRIPFYKLPKVLIDHPELKETSKLSFRESLKCIRLALWDEVENKMVTFAEARNRQTAAA